MGYTKSQSFIEFLMECCIHDKKIYNTYQLIKDKILLHFKVSKLGQILCVDKIGFFRPSHAHMVMKGNSPIVH